MSALIHERPDDHIKFLKKQLSLSQNNALTSLHNGPVKGPIKENVGESSPVKASPGWHAKENRNSPRSSPVHRSNRSLKDSNQNGNSPVHRPNILSKEPVRKGKAVRIQNVDSEHAQKSTGSQPLFHLTQSDSVGQLLERGNANQSNNVSKSTSSVGAIRKRPLVGRSSKSYNGPRLTGNRLGFDRYPPGYLQGVGDSNQFSISGQGLDPGPSVTQGNHGNIKHKSGKLPSNTSPPDSETCTSPLPPRLPPLSLPVPSLTKGR